MTCLGRLATYPITQSSIQPSQERSEWSAKYRGSSLNDKLLQGPDLTNSLVGVLMRFRQESVALMADVEAMFHQVRVKPGDCSAMRFLWWPDGDLDSEPEEHMMTVHLFGGVSSPSCANFALCKTAEDNKALFDPQIIHTAVSYTHLTLPTKLEV